MPILMSQRINQVWAVYNHLPGGQLVAIHFEDIVRRRRGSAGEEEVKFTAKEQLEAFKRTPQVAINIKGKVTKNELIVYEGPDLAGNRRAANVALEWARGKGAEPMKLASEKAVQGFETTRRIEALEERINSVDSKLDKILETVKK